VPAEKVSISEVRNVAPQNDANFGIGTLAGLLLGKTTLDSVYGEDELDCELRHCFGGVIRPISRDLG
jgi:hypothetical protein